MTLLELGHRVYAGAFIIAGELRWCDVQEAGFVDKKTGIAEKTLLLTFFIECTGIGSFEFVKVTRRLPLGDEAAERMRQSVQKGSVYAFDIVGFERKPGYLAARMAPVDPVLIHRDSPPASAP